jgi:hypothetical protein
VTPAAIGDRPSRPWGDDPPPAPASATWRDRRRVRSAWRSWSHFRPYYVREDDRIEAVIDLKDNVWHGSAPVRDGMAESEAAWAALQACIGSWRSPRASERW